MIEGTPICLSASNTLASGASAITDAGRLQSPARTPMLINEVRFLVRSPDDSNSFSRIDNLGGLIRAKLQVGPFEISSGFVPLWLYGITHNNYDGHQGVIGLEIANRVNFYSLYRWRFKRPLYVPPGTAITANYIRDVDSLMSATGTAFVEMAYSGYALPTGPDPKKIDVPYIASYVTTENVGTAIAGEAELRNPFRQALEIYRAIGRIRGRRTTSINNYDSAGIGFAAGNADVRIRVSTSDDYNLVRDFVPFSCLFDVNRRAWDFHYILPSDQWLRVQLQGINQAPAATNLAVMMSIMGQREEKL